MPEALTHYYFAKDLVDALDEKYKQQANLTNPKLFLYANFFDLAYYYRLKGLFTKDQYRISHKIHQSHANEMIETAIIFTRESGFDKDNVALIMGMVSHYVLDLMIHPYIHGNSNPKVRGSHGKLERDIDYHFALERESLELGKINLVKHFKGAFILNFEDYAIIEEMIKKTYYVSRTYEYYRKSMKCYKHFLLHTSKDHFKIKAFFYSLNDKTINRKSSICTRNFIYPKKYKYDKDVLNKNHAIWFDKTKNQDSTQSFEDVYQIALRQGKLYLKAALDYLFLNNKKEFEKLFKSISLN